MEASANHQLPLVGSHSRNDLIDQRWFPSPNHDNKRTMQQFKSQEEIPLDDVKQLARVFHDSWKFMTKNVRYEDAVICLGNTRSGKSAFINALLGNRFKAEKIGKRGAIALSLADDQSTGPEIGSGSSSKTIIPSRWTSHSLIIYDAPGFDDTSGVIQDTINASYIFHLIQNVKSLKIVVVVDINDILNDNVKPFTSVLNALEKLSGDQMKSMFSSLTIVFTKVPEFIDGNLVDINFITETIIEQFLTDPKFYMSPSTKEFLRNITKHSDRIALFKRVKPGEDIFVPTDNIIKVISNSTSLNKSVLKTLNVTIADSSIKFLFYAHREIISKMNFNVLGESLRCVVQSKIQDLNKDDSKPMTEDEIKETLSDYISLKNKLKAAVKQRNLLQKIILLQSIDVSFEEEIIKNELIENVHLLEFFDEMLKIQGSVLEELNLQSILNFLLKEVKLAYIHCQFRFNQIHKKELNDLLEMQHLKFLAQERQLKELQEKTQEENAKKYDFYKNLAFTVATLLCSKFV